MSQQNFIGIEIGGTKLQLVSADDSLAIQERFAFAVNEADGAIGIQKQIEEVIATIKNKKNITAVGVGFGGPVNYQTGKIALSHHIPGWENFDLREWLMNISAAPVFIDNDANIAALGEAVHGAGAGYNIVFYMTVGSGIGGGIVIDKKIYHGAYPGEVEVGHLRLNKEGDILESRCSGWTVDRKIRAVAEKLPFGLLAKMLAGTEKGEARFLKEAVENGDSNATSILNETADDLAFGLSHVVHLFHPNVLIIGGGLSLTGEYLRDAIADALPQYVMKAFHPVPEIKLASLGKDVVPVGALELAKSSISTNT